MFPTVRLALPGAARRDPARFRVVHFSIQRDHVHLIVEASDKRALSSGVRSVAIRIALYVNELLARHGPLWADRWHGRPRTSPSEVRNALIYVLANFRKHARRALRPGVDPYSSAPWFDGFREARVTGMPPPLAERASSGFALEGELPRSFAPRTCLLRVGWRRRGLIRTSEAPAHTQA